AATCGLLGSHARTWEPHHAAGPNITRLARGRQARTNGPVPGPPRRAALFMNGTPYKGGCGDMRALGSVRAMDGAPAAHMDVLAAVPKARISPQRPPTAAPKRS